MPTTDHQVLADPDLVAQARAGEPMAIHRLIGAVRRAVHAYTRARLPTCTGGAEAADDVTQEVCLAVVNVLPRYQENGAPFAALVFRIAKNKIVDARRRSARSPVHVGDELPDQSEPALGPEQQTIARSDVEVVRSLLDQLPVRTARVVWLRAQGLGASEVGAVVGLTANAVRVTQHRGVTAVRRLVAGSSELRERFADRGFLRRTPA